MKASKSKYSSRKKYIQKLQLEAQYQDRTNIQNINATLYITTAVEKH